MMETLAGVEYDFASRCLNCGVDETDDPGVVVTELGIEDPNPRIGIRKQQRKRYECEACGATSHQTGPVETGKQFGFARVPVDRPKMPIRIDGTEIQYREAEAFILESELYDQTGIVTGGRNRTVLIWAFESPTFTQGGSHRVELGEYLDERMMLLGIKYYTSDDPWRRLSFHRGLDHGILEMIEGLAETDGGEGSR